MSDELMNRVRAVLELNETLECADERDLTIRDLMAEVERLENDLEDQSSMLAIYRDQSSKDSARLRELASAEAVAWAKFDGTEITHMEMSDGSGADFDLVGSGFADLIRRPEMPK